MFRIPLKVKNLEKIKDANGVALKMSWAQTIEDMCQFTKDGFTPAEMRLAIKIIDKLEIQEKELSLSKAEYDFLMERLNIGFKFRFADKTILEFIEDLEQVKED